MINSIGGYEVPINLKQLENANLIKPDNQLKLDEGPGKVLDSFGEILQKQINETNSLHKDAEKAQMVYATGGNVSLHEVMIKTEKAEMAMQLTLQLRNKLVNSYKEIANMHV